MKPFSLFLLIGLALLSLAGCSALPGTEKTTLRIVSGSENETLEPIVKRFADQNGLDIKMSYKGSVDISMILESDAPEYDAVWPANSLWITLGDTNHRVKNSESIMRSPVVLGVKKSVAQKLGWIGKDVTVQDILKAAESDQLRLMMTSATQSNSGASAYFGFLNAFADNPDVLSADNLQNPNIRAQVKRILSKVDRSSESSGWLRDLFLREYARYDAMFNYEALIIEMNQALVQRGDEPLYVVYPVNGLAIADSPLAYVNQGDEKKQEAFLKLQQYLLSDAVQQEILGKGRRTGLIGLAPEKADRAVFNPDWGVDVNRVLSPIRFPSAPVIREALDLYQSSLRKPSFTVYALDYSGSMSGEGETQLKQAMQTLLDQQRARQYLLQASPDDVTIVLLFNGGVINANDVSSWMVRGNDPQALNALLGRIQNFKPGGDTNIYSPVALGLEQMKAQGIVEHFPAIILMTDGQSNRGSIDEIQNAIAGTGLNNVPVYAITFGDASVDQLNRVTELTGGRVYDGTKDLVTAFRKAKGNN